MGAGARGAAGWILALAALAAPAAALFALIIHRGMEVAGALAVLQSVLIAWIASSFAPNNALKWTCRGGALAATLALWGFTAPGALAAAAAPHALAYAGLLALFLASLRPGREAILTIVARAHRGPLPQSMERYSRNVTWIWCGFFLFQLAGSLGLALLSPTRAWPVFVNVLNLPLLMAMFLVEYAFRLWRFGSHPGGQQALADWRRIMLLARARQ